MRKPLVAQQATLKFRDDTPIELLWDNNRWQVLDIPTRIGLDADAIYSPLVTHPPAPWKGWRFIARAGDDTASYVFDLIETSPGQFHVASVYD